jgi:predicted nucleic acid-binding protein
MLFVDTNVLLYAVSARAEEEAKSARARDLLNRPDLALSVQVLQEFYVQATRASAADRLEHDTAVEFIRTLERFPVQDINAPLMHAALSAAVRWRISYWDAAIVEAARALECSEVLSEDLQHGQNYGGVRVLDPFRQQ